MVEEKNMLQYSNSQVIQTGSYRLKLVIEYHENETQIFAVLQREMSEEDGEDLSNLQLQVVIHSLACSVELSVSNFRSVCVW